MTDLRRSYLVQRLDPPSAGLGPFVDNPFSFGGGLQNGGLSDEAMGLLRGIFSFDYMGAAEFEFGAVPEALSRIARNTGSFVASSFSLPLAKVERAWNDKTKTEPDGDAEVFVLCDKEHVKEVRRRITAWAAGKPPKDDQGYAMHLKERTNLGPVLRPHGDYTPRTCGWLELDNGFFFFIDRAMWQATADLFGVHVPEEANR